MLTRWVSRASSQKTSQGKLQKLTLKDLEMKVGEPFGATKSRGNQQGETKRLFFKPETCPPKGAKPNVAVAFPHLSGLSNKNTETVDLPLNLAGIRTPAKKYVLLGSWNAKGTPKKPKKSKRGRNILK